MTRSSRFHRSDAAFGTWIVGLVGLGMTLGFGALFVGALLDLRAFPSAPRPVTVATAAAMSDPVRGTWLRLLDARFECRFPPRERPSPSTRRPSHPWWAPAPDRPGVE